MNNETPQPFTHDIIIGLEIHIGLETQTKLFCSCTNEVQHNKETETVDEFGFKVTPDLPNIHCCPVCLGHPGAKPVLNNTALLYATRLALALQCEVAQDVVFSRKTYFYPDLAKNYQITQFEEPLGKRGFLEYDIDKKVRLTRIHIEEDPAAIVHDAGLTQSQYSLLDYNRSGNPLCELVTEPDLHSPQQAREFIKSLITLLGYLDIFDTKNGLLKADANVSIKESGYSRVEIKNINGLREIERALTYEISRQKEVVARGMDIVLETRAWDAEAGVTHSLRKKESEDDYGYIFDTDLPLVTLEKDYCGNVEASIPKLPIERMHTLISTYGIPHEDAKTITSSYLMARLFDDLIKTYDARLVSRWIKNQIIRYQDDLDTYEKNVKDGYTSIVNYTKEFFTLLAEKKINENTAKDVLEETIAKLSSPIAYVKRYNLEMVGNTEEIENICSEEIANAPAVVEDYKSGRTEAINYIVGQVMKRTKGKADPIKVKEIITTQIKRE